MMMKESNLTKMPCRQKGQPIQRKQQAAKMFNIKTSSTYLCEYLDRIVFSCLGGSVIYLFSFLAKEIISASLYPV